ncbi:DNA ligase [subsurface metagenome]
MLFYELCKCYNLLEKTRKKLEMVDILSNTLKNASSKEIGKISLLTLGKIHPDFIGIELMLAERMAIKALTMASGRSEKSVLKYLEEIGDLGETSQKLLKGKTQSSLLVFTKQEEKYEPEVLEIWNLLNSIAKMSGEGSSDRKIRTLSGLISRVQPLEARYIMRIVCGQLRLGVATQLLMDALSKAVTGSRENKYIIERAYNRCADISKVAETLYEEGLETVQKIDVQVFNPIKVMLAQRVSSSDELIKRFGGKSALEYKYDGLRVQVHVKDRKVKLFSRSSEDITNQFPDVCKFILEALKEDNFIVEGEVVAYDYEKDKILPFQHLSQRKRKHNIEQKMMEIPLRVFLFDALFFNGKSLLESNYIERRSSLHQIIEETKNIQFSHQTLVSSTDEIEAFFHQALEDNYEGIMGKSIDENSSYQAGTRGFSWVKYKADYVDNLSDSFDLVILGAEYGKGKRAGKYGTFLLGCFDIDEGVYRTFTRVATGFSDNELDSFYTILSSLKADKPKDVISSLNSSVWFEPKIVVEVSGAEITVSQIHTCAKNHLENPQNGLALRFPRFTGRIVEDKSPEEITSVEEILTIYLNQRNKIDVSNNV